MIPAAKGVGKRGLAVRKWFIIFAILIVGVLAALWWLGSEVETSKPEPGEVRVEIDNAF